ncbi:DUF4132 domain-containing protein [Glycomyces buryatensis]|uniref:DUF4132 domain-containing protein n=1 Tax=Glycomyces buryatensis TaxID=2570927 RepID=A0A4S8Q2T8_9ACTN|nr:DUF4132 domain-containing protein [Glycomyces buryatensis]THV38507.1 DUF4132 domain-containing protein [Glycomyces buryatensis]
MKPDPTLPDEDRLAISQNWLRLVRPLRGRTKPREVKLDPEAGRERLASADQVHREFLALPLNHEYAAAALAFMDGESDVAGAATVLVLTATANPGEPLHKPRYRPVFDLLVAEHGLPFAMSAVAESLTLEKRTNETPGVAIIPLSHQNFWWSTARSEEDLICFRALLAAASDADYAAVVAELGTRRTDLIRRVVVSALLPGEKDWMDEVCVEAAATRPGSLPPLLAQSITTEKQLNTLGGVGKLPEPHHPHDYADLLVRFGTGALPLLLKRATWSSGDVANLRAIGALPSDAAMEFLVDNLDKRRVLNAAKESATRFPKRMLRAVASRVEGADADQRKRLAVIVHSHPILLDAALPELDAEIQSALEPLVDMGKQLPEAPSEMVPELLTAPPWREPLIKGRPTLVSGLTPPQIQEIRWDPDEQRDWAEPTPPYVGNIAHAEWKKRAESDPLLDGTAVIVMAFAPDEFAEPVMRRWRFGGYWCDPDYVRAALARFGSDLLEQVLAVARADVLHHRALLPIVSLDVARIMANALVWSRPTRPIARAWLERHAEDAAALLIPDALGEDRRAWRCAGEALRFLTIRRGPDLVCAAAEQYGDEAIAAIRELVDFDPLRPVGVRIPRTIPWATLPLLPQVALRGGEAALPDATIRQLLNVMAADAPDCRYAGTDHVLRSCDPTSLARFSWAVFEQWTEAGSPASGRWALTQLARFGDDETARRLASRALAWKRGEQDHRVLREFAVLAAIDGDVALRGVGRIVDRTECESLREAAVARFKATAKARGLSPDQLSDLLIPESGPDVKMAVEDLADRLERHMIDGHIWAMEDFHRSLVRQPLAWPLTRNLLWQAKIGRDWTSFRVAEDRTLSDVAEREVRFSARTLVRLAHPANLGAELDRWAEIFADYLVVQPIEQLSRPVLTFTEEELKTSRLTRFEGVEVDIEHVLELMSRGWRRDSSQHEWLPTGLAKRMRGTGYAILHLTPGIAGGTRASLPLQCLGIVTLSRIARFDVPKDPRPLREVDPVSVAEALADLARLGSHRSN